jgi:hypothetical protein
LEVNATMPVLTLGEWLRPSDLKDGDILTIADEGTVRSASETPFGREVFEIRVRLPGGEEKVWTMNLTTQRRLIDAWGKDTRSWVGRKVRVQLQQQNVRGIVKTVIYGTPVAGAEPAAKAPSAPSAQEAPRPPGKVPEIQLRGFLKAHADQIGAEIPGPASSIEPEVLAEAEALGLIETFEVKGKKMYLLTEEGKKLAEAG